MKQFIVMLAVLPIMILFALQFSLDQITAYKTSCAGRLVDSAAISAGLAGEFTDSAISSLREDLESLGFDNADISIVIEDGIPVQADNNGSGSSVVRGYMIPYTVTLIMKSTFASGVLRGQNYSYVLRGYAVTDVI